MVGDDSLRDGARLSISAIERGPGPYRRGRHRARSCGATTRSEWGTVTKADVSRNPRATWFARDDRFRTTGDCRSSRISAPLPTPSVALLL
jgi:hypothetical protein